MAGNRWLDGGMGQCRRPEWGPLENLLGSDELVSHFMWMYDIKLQDGTIVNAYKHRWTRRYLHLSADGRTFEYGGEDQYLEIESYLALGQVFARWDCCEPTAGERAALRAVLRKALGED